MGIILELEAIKVYFPHNCFCVATQYAISLGSEWNFDNNYETGPCFVVGTLLWDASYENDPILQNSFVIYFMKLSTVKV